MPKTFIEYCTSWVNSIIWKVLHWLKKREFPSSANKNSCSRRKENVNILKARCCRLHAPCERGKWTEMHFLHNDEAGWCGPSVPRWFLCRASGFSANVTSLTLCSFAKSSWSLWHVYKALYGLGWRTACNGHLCSFSSKTARSSKILWFLRLTKLAAFYWSKPGSAKLRPHLCFENKAGDTSGATVKEGLMRWLTLNKKNKNTDSYCFSTLQLQHESEGPNNSSQFKNETDF